MTFDDLIEHLSEDLNTSLVPDQEQTVSILIDDHLRLQIEMDDQDKRFFFLIYIYELPAGKFRENVFISALRANHLPIRIGELGFFSEENYFTFHKFLSNDTPKEEITETLNEVIYVAEKWKKALDSGRSEPDDMFLRANNPPPEPFGLRP